MGVLFLDLCYLPKILQGCFLLINKYFCKYGWKIDFAYPEVGRAPGTPGEDVDANMYVQKRPRSPAKVALMLSNKKSVLWWMGMVHEEPSKATETAKGNLLQ